MNHDVHRWAFPMWFLMPFSVYGAQCIHSGWCWNTRTNVHVQAHSPINLQWEPWTMISLFYCIFLPILLLSLNKRLDITRHSPCMHVMDILIVFFWGFAFCTRIKPCGLLVCTIIWVYAWLIGFRIITRDIGTAATNRQTKTAGIYLCISIVIGMNAQTNLTGDVLPPVDIKCCNYFH